MEIAPVQSPSDRELEAFKTGLNRQLFDTEYV